MVSAPYGAQTGQAGCPGIRPDVRVLARCRMSSCRSDVRASLGLSSISLGRTGTDVRALAGRPGRREGTNFWGFGRMSGLAVVQFV